LPLLFFTFSFSSFSSLFFFLLIRPPPKSPLFPTRRSSDLTELSRTPANTSPSPARKDALWSPRLEPSMTLMSQYVKGIPWTRIRSEEHTSELQSLTNLVCRLLLEKKKKKK